MASPAPNSTTPTHDVSSSSSSSDADIDEKVQWRCVTDDRYKEVKEQVKANMSALTIALVANKPTFWGLQIRTNLSWYNGSRYAKSEQITEACDSWDGVCGVEFKQARSPKDAFIQVRDATFEEEHARSNRGVIASAFFPGETKREIVIFRRFATQFNSVAVLCHELGHVLGFRHEHIWTKLAGRSDDEQEPVDFKDPFTGKVWGAEKLTEYDPDSIMHYQKLWDDEKAHKITTLSRLDEVGAQLVYGQSNTAVMLL
eukprot:TRINITY_DN1086_c0_g1_i4.p2 TRINITY_DN1086_c0_g1~~TRINITY_DN1086_c0_g1_i4.p2  ORF type:complete len:257 (-),score=65.61 TRINITY_DN1086_c0_g1_i4:199-969(-)